MNKDKYRSYQHSRRDGFGMNLYRNVQAKKLGGVCAGIADHFEIDHNIMRVVFVGGFFLSQGAIVWLYVAGYIILAPRPQTDVKIDYEYDERERCYRRKNMFRYQRSSRERLKDAHQRLKGLLDRVEVMERYVTSSRYDLHQEFADLEK